MKISDKERRLLTAILLAQILKDGKQMLPAMIDLAIDGVDMMCEELHGKPMRKRKSK